MSNDQWAPQGDPQPAPYAAAPYGTPAPYGAAPGTPSGYPQAPAPRRSGAALASMIVGIIALLVCLIPIVNIVSIIGGIVAVVLGIVGIRKLVPGVVTGKGMAVAGIITGAIATVVAVLMLALVGAALNSIDPEELQRTIDEAVAEVEESQAAEVEESQAAEEPATESGLTAEDVPADGERFDFSAATCEDLADEAVLISQEGGDLLSIVEVSELAIGEDHRTDYDVPSGTDESLVLSCTGTAAWEDGSSDPVLLELTLDGAGEVYVYYDLR